MQRVLELPQAWSCQAAVWAPCPPQPAAGFPPFKPASKGTWLHSEGHTVLGLEFPPPDDAAPEPALQPAAAAASPPVARLTCTLAGAQRLLAAPLPPGSFSFRSLCPQHSGAGAGHVVVLTLAHGVATLAFHFDAAQAGRECAAALAALAQGRVEAPPAEAPPSLMQQGREQQQQQQQHGATPAGGAGDGMPQDDEQLMRAIQAYLLDPAFMAYVDRVEQLWLRLEAEAEGERRQQQGGGGTG